METYTLLRHMADSWGMLLMFLLFAGVMLWAFRPGSRQVHSDIANSIFRNEREPLAEATKPDRTEA